MPVWLRQFTFRKINDFYEKEAEAAKKASGKSTLKGSITEIELMLLAPLRQYKKII